MNSTPPASRWLTAAIGLLSLAVIGSVIMTRIDYAGVWDGDPAIHLRSAMEGANVFVQEMQSGGNPLRGFLHAFYYIPKALHEILLITFLVVVNGFDQLDFGQAEFLAAVFATLWSIVGIAALYATMQRFACRNIALVLLPLVALSGYVVLYANYQKGNMPSHALVWLASFVYISARSRSDYLRWRPALAIAVLFGLSVPTHYSSLYWLLAIGASEAVLIVWDRQWVRTAAAFLLIGAVTVAILASLDGFRYLLLEQFPRDRSWNGSMLASPRFTLYAGFTYVFTRVLTNEMSFKVLEPDWRYIGQLWLANFGPVGCVLALAGGWEIGLRLRRLSAAAVDVSARATLIVMAVVLFTLILSLGTFQNVRKLAPLYPFWAALMVMGSVRLASLATTALGSRASPGADAEATTGTALLVPVIVLLVHALSYGPEVTEIYDARRNAGYMREFMQREQIDRVLTMPNNVATELVPDQGNLRILSAAEAEGYDYISFQWLLRFTHGEEMMACFRAIGPVASYPTQASLALYQLEHSLRKSFIDVDDPLTRNRTLFAWQPVRDKCLDSIRARGFFERAGDKGSGPVITESSGRKPAP